MNSRELIKAIVAHETPYRAGRSYNPPHQNDIMELHSCSLLPLEGMNPEYRKWGRHEELLAQTDSFSGDVLLDGFGNILGRLNQKTKGECVVGALKEWEDFDTFKLPEIDKSFYSEELIEACKNSDKYVIAGSPFAVFSILRDTRLMTNALMDVILEPDYVEAFLAKILERNLELVEILKDCHVDAMMFWDDWGTQDRTFISPQAFKDLFKPIYKAIAERLHSYGMSLFVHSCGYNYAYMDDFIEAGIDVLQFDQLGIYGYEKMADEFAGKVTFWSPLDIQKTLPTGDKELIESQAKIMINAFKGKGALIIKDYPTYQDINVKEEWVQWARDVFDKEDME